MNAIGIILAGGKSRRLGELAQRRSVAAMPVGGCYRSIDFALSSMANSGIKTVAVITQYNARSLTEHLNSSKWWNFGRKNGGLFVLSPTITSDNSGWYKGTADAMYQNISYLKRYHQPYVVISNGDCVYKIDYKDLVDYHINTGADITVVCKQMPDDCDVTRYGVVELNDENQVVSFEEKPLVTEGHMISAGVYCIRRRTLIELLEKNAEEGRYDFVGDILFRYRNVKKIMGYELNTYWGNVADAEDYYKINMDFLKPEVRDFFSREDDRILTKAADLSPAKFNIYSSVKNSMAASGCIINGRVENSVLFKSVYIGRNSTIKNSVILNNVRIEDNVTVEDCIVESSSLLEADTSYKGKKGDRIVSKASKDGNYRY